LAEPPGRQGTEGTATKGTAAEGTAAEGSSRAGKGCIEGKTKEEAEDTLTREHKREAIG
jgi:hypothetical protein